MNKIEEEATAAAAQAYWGGTLDKPFLMSDCVRIALDVALPAVIKGLIDHAYFYEGMEAEGGTSEGMIEAIAIQNFLRGFLLHPEGANYKPEIPSEEELVAFQKLVRREAS